jgi:hypothetical protein
MRIFGISLAIALFTTGAVVYAERARAGVDTAEMDTAGYCFIISYGGSRRKYCI